MAETVTRPLSFDKKFSKAVMARKRRGALSLSQEAASARLLEGLLRRATNARLAVTSPAGFATAVPLQNDIGVTWLQPAAALFDRRRKKKFGW